MWKKKIFFTFLYSALHNQCSCADSKLSGDKELPEEIARDGHGAKTSVAVKTLVRLLTCLEY